MLRPVISFVALALTLVASMGRVTLAEESEFNDVISVGEDAPDFAGLPGIDGKPHSLKDYKKAKAVVVVFTSNPCPVAIAYEDRLVALQKEFAKQDVRFVAICSNFEAGNTLEDLKKRASQKKFNFPVLRDEDQSTGRAYGASKTPHVFLLDRERKIAYMGAVDDNEVPEKIAQHYLRDAIESVLAGTEPATKETRPFGCTLRYKRRPASRAK